MPNESKIHDERSWEKWRRSGAIGNMLTAKTAPMRRTALPIVGIGEIHSGNGGGYAVLSIGEMVVDRGKDSSGSPWEVTVPECYAVVPNHEFSVGQRIRTGDLPPGSTTVEDFLRQIK